MNAPAGHVVTPGLVEGTERLGGKHGDALRDAAVLGVGADAARLGLVADGRDPGGLRGRGGEAGAAVEGAPVGEVGDPGVVFEDEAVVVEVPVGDLVRGELVWGKFRGEVR